MGISSQCKTWVSTPHIRHQGQVTYVLQVKSAVSFRMYGKSDGVFFTYRCKCHRHARSGGFFHF